jgi:hypothetical protein
MCESKNTTALLSALGPVILACFCIARNFVPPLALRKKPQP